MRPLKTSKHDDELCAEQEPARPQARLPPHREAAARCDRKQPLKSSAGNCQPNVFAIRSASSRTWVGPAG